MKGYCECRQVCFEVNGPIEDFSHCHCSQCRRVHGAAYATFAGVAASSFRYLTVDTSITTYESSPGNQRIFCSNCGSAIMAVLGSSPDMLYLSMSTLEGDPPRPEAYHIFVDSKAPWHEINDDLPTFPEDTD